MAPPNHYNNNSRGDNNNHQRHSNNNNNNNNNHSSSRYNNNDNNYHQRDRERDQPRHRDDRDRDRERDRDNHRDSTNPRAAPATGYHKQRSDNIGGYQDNRQPRRNESNNNDDNSRLHRSHNNADNNNRSNDLQQRRGGDRDDYRDHRRPVDERGNNNNRDDNGRDDNRGNNNNNNAGYQRDRQQQQQQQPQAQQQQTSQSQQMQHHHNHNQYQRPPQHYNSSNPHQGGGHQHQHHHSHNRIAPPHHHQHHNLPPGPHSEGLLREILLKVGTTNIPVYFSAEALSPQQLQEQGAFADSLPSGRWMEPSLPIRVTAVSCSAKHVLRCLGCYLLAPDNGDNQTRVEAQKFLVPSAFAEGTLVNLYLYKEHAVTSGSGDDKRVEMRATCTPLAIKTPFSMLMSQGFDELDEELKRNSLYLHGAGFAGQIDPTLISQMQKEQNSPLNIDPLLRAIFELKPSRVNIKDGATMFVICPAPL